MTEFACTCDVYMYKCVHEYMSVLMYMYLILRLVTLSIRGETPFALHKL